MVHGIIAHHRCCQNLKIDSILTAWAYVGKNYSCGSIPAVDLNQKCYNTPTSQRNTLPRMLSKCSEG